MTNRSSEDDPEQYVGNAFNAGAPTPDMEPEIASVPVADESSGAGSDSPRPQDPIEAQDESPGASTDAPGSEDPIEAQKDEIAQTRAEMSVTIDAIQEKLSPEHIVEEAKGRAYDATVGRVQPAVSGVAATARESVVSSKQVAQRNPRGMMVMGTIAGVTIALIMTIVGRQRSKSALQRRIEEEKARSAVEPQSRSVQLANLLSQIQNRISDIAGSATPPQQSKINAAKGKAGDKASQMATAATVACSLAKLKASRASSQASEQVQSLAGRTKKSSRKSQRKAAKNSARAKVQGTAGSVSGTTQDNPATTAAIILDIVLLLIGRFVDARRQSQRS